PPMVPAHRISMEDHVKTAPKWSRNSKPASCPVRVRRAAAGRLSGLAQPAVGERAFRSLKQSASTKTLIDEMTPVNVFIVFADCPVFDRLEPRTRDTSLAVFEPCKLDIRLELQASSL
ncbi:MAG: hypothetical protein OXP07_13680, partial [Defluviicoccus sp.]|nr:hypothetical protein [Defluviicoccus sp.]